MQKTIRLKSFIGDEIRDKITTDHLPSAMDDPLIAKAIDKAKKNLQKPRTIAKKK